MNWTRSDTRALFEAARDVPHITRGAVRVVRRHAAEDGLIERMARFERFCAATDPLPHAWGTSDCSILVADWVQENGHPDPAAHLRGTYGSEPECGALLARHGGLLPLFKTCMEERAGLRAILEPRFGAVAIIGSSHNEGRQWAAIWNGYRWMVKWGDATKARWTPFAARPLGMWAV